MNEKYKEAEILYID